MSKSFREVTGFLSYGKKIKKEAIKKVSTKKISSVWELQVKKESGDEIAGYQITGEEGNFKVMLNMKTFDNVESLEEAKSKVSESMEKMFFKPTNEWKQVEGSIKKEQKKFSYNQIKKSIMEKFAPKRAPKKWWDEKYKEVKKGNPKYDDEQIRKTVGDIWYNEISDSKRKEILKRYEKGKKKKKSYNQIKKAFLREIELKKRDTNKIHGFLQDADTGEIGLRDEKNDKFLIHFKSTEDAKNKGWDVLDRMDLETSEMITTEEFEKRFPKFESKKTEKSLSYSVLEDMVNHYIHNRDMSRTRARREAIKTLRIQGYDVSSIPESKDVRHETKKTTKISYNQLKKAEAMKGNLFGDFYYVIMEELSNGDLKIIPKETIEEDEVKDIGEIFEDVIGNTGLEWVAPEDIEAMTEAPILGEVERTDKGEITKIHNIWWYPDYMVKNPADELKAGEFIIFKKA